MNCGPEKKLNTISNKYPSHRDEYVKGCWKWLKGRRADDNAEGLWRVQDKLYDLSGFIDRHPGGREWLILAKGTDITEAFEVFHLSTAPAEMLHKFYVREASEPRNYRLTFAENGFYKTLKRRCLEHLKTIDVKAHEWKSNLIFDAILLGLLVCACLSITLVDKNLRFVSIVAAGALLSCLINTGHNYTHKKNSWRMYGCHVVFINFREFRVIHSMSHHLYPNSIYDLETTIFEPFLVYLPVAKSSFRIFLNYFWVPVVYYLGLIGAFVYRCLGTLQIDRKTDRQIFYLDDLIGLSFPLFMCCFGMYFGVATASETLMTWIKIICAGSVWFNVMAVSVGHHGTAIMHEGDEFKSLDFGIYQLAATIDRFEANSNLFMVLTHYGEHVMHHMLPTLDHSLLFNFRQILEDTCLEFMEDLKMVSMSSTYFEHLVQLKRSEVKTLAAKKAQ